MSGLDPSRLPGTHRTRVFVGGGYAPKNRRLLDVIEQSVIEAGFVPMIADRFTLLRPERDIHDVTLFLLHACRLAIFEVSTLSGALMEIERLADYGIRKALLIYQHPFRKAWPSFPDSWRNSQMVKSLVIEQQEKLIVRPYTRPADAAVESRRFLSAVRRSLYGKLHSL